MTRSSSLSPDSVLEEHAGRLLELLSELSPCNYATLLRLRAILTWFDTSDPIELQIPGWMAGRAEVLRLALIGHFQRFPPHLDEGPSLREHVRRYTEARCLAALTVETFSRFLDRIPQLPAAQRAPLVRLLASYRNLPPPCIAFSFEDEISGPSPLDPEDGRTPAENN